MSFLYNHKTGVSFRKIEVEDASLLKALKDESWWGTTHVTILNEANEREWILKATNDSTQLQLLAHAPVDEKVCPVGLYKITQLDFVNRSYTSAHDTFLGYRNRGFGTKILQAGVDFGFEVLNVHRLNTEVMETNLASMTCAMSVGFIKEGVHRKELWRGGQWINNVILGMLREEWEKLPRVIEWKGVCHLP